MNPQTHSVITEIIGTEDITRIVSNTIFALIGAIILMLMEVTKRRTRAKVEFNWCYFISDNAKRLLISSLLIFIFLRFLPELTGIQLNHFMAFAVGLCSDKLSKYLKEAKREMFNKDGKDNNE